MMGSSIWNGFTYLKMLEFMRYQTSVGWFYLIYSELNKNPQLHNDDHNLPRNLLVTIRDGWSGGLFAYLFSDYQYLSRAKVKAVSNSNSRRSMKRSFTYKLTNHLFYSAVTAEFYEVAVEIWFKVLCVYVLMYAYVRLYPFLSPI